MADLSRSIEIIFGAVDNASGAIQGVGDSISQLGDGVGAASAPLAGLFDNIVAVNGAIAALGAAALGYAYNEAAEFKSATLDLEKVLGDGEGTVDDYRGKITELANAYGVAGKDVVGSTADFKQSGFSIKEAFDLVDASLQAFNISELSAAQASESFISILNGFGEPASSVTRVMDSLNEISNKNAASFGELADGMAILAPNARQLGLSIEETAGYLTPVIEVFGSGAESARGLRTAFLRLTDPTKEAREGIQKLAEETGKSIPLQGNFKDTIAGLADAWEGADADTRAYLSSIIAGKEQSGKFAIVLDNFNKVAEVTSQAMDSAGSAAKELAVRMESPEVAINRTKVAFGSLAVAIGDQYLKEATGAVTATGNLAAAFADLINSGGLEPLFEKLRPLFAEFENDVNLIAKALPDAVSQVDFTPVTTALSRLGDAFDGLFDNVDITTPDGLAKAMQKLVDVGGTLIDITSGIVKSFQPLIDYLSEATGELGGLSPELSESIGEWIGFGKQLNLAAGYLSDAGDAISGIGAAIAGLAGISALRGLVELLGSIGDFVPNINLTATALGELLGKAGLVAAAGAAGYGIGTGIQAGIDTAVNALTEGEESLGTWIASLVNANEEAALMEQINAPVAVGLSKFADASKQAAESTKEMGEAVGSTFEVNEEFFNFAGTQMPVAFGKLSDGADKTTLAIEDNKEAIKNNMAALDSLSGRIVSSEERSKEFAKELIKSTRSMEGLKIQSALAKAALGQVGETMESLSATASSIGDVLSASVSAIASITDPGAFVQVSGVIDQQKRLQDKAVSEQIEQSKALRKYYESLRSRAESGDALITVSGDDLAPELEAFMFAVLERIQISASAEGLDFLLGGA